MGRGESSGLSGGSWRWKQPGVEQPVRIRTHSAEIQVFTFPFMGHSLHIFSKPRHCASGTNHGVVVTGGYPTTRFGPFSEIPPAHGSSIYTSLGSELLSCFSAEAGFLFLR